MPHNYREMASTKSFPPVAPAYFDLKGASAYVGRGLSVKRLRKALTEPGGLPHFRIGGKILISKKDLDLWLIRFRQEPISLDLLVEEVMAEFKDGHRKKTKGKQN